MGRAVGPADPWVNTRSIAESTSIPRETVRRKIADLVRIGWAAQDGTNLHFTMQAWEELTAIRRKRERLAVTYYEIIRQGIGDPPSHSD